MNTYIAGTLSEGLAQGMMEAVNKSLRQSSAADFEQSFQPVATGLIHAVANSLNDSNLSAQISFSVTQIITEVKNNTIANDLANGELLEKIGHNFGTSFANAFINFLNNSETTSQISYSIAQVLEGIYNNTIAEKLDNFEFQQQIGQKLGELIGNATLGTGWNATSAGLGLRNFLNDLIQRVNLTSIASNFTGELYFAFNEGIKNAKIENSTRHFTSELTKGMDVFNHGMEPGLERFRSHLNSFFTKMARDTTLNTLPWVALGGAILVGTPALVMYLYKKAIHNIGRPKLAQEVRKVGIWDRTTDGIRRSISCIWDSTQTGIKWSTLAGASGFLLAIIEAMASKIFTGETGYGGKVLSNLSCLKERKSECEGDAAFLLILDAIYATSCIGLLSISVDLVNNFYNFVEKSIKKDEEPVFNKELQKTIDVLTTSTYNIKLNSGYMQNLLLYGPGGTGKTMIAKYIAKNSRMNYVMMSGGDLAQYIKRGEHVTELNKLFADARNCHSPTIIFIDECESLCGDRGKMDKSELVELVNSFLNQTGEPSKKIMVILTTNRKDDLDPAVLNRMDHKLYIGLPQQAERKKIIELYLPKFMTTLERREVFTDKLITTIANQTEGFAGRTIFKMLNTMSCMRAATNNNKLTERMVVDTVSTFIKQEAYIVSKK